MHNLNKYKCYRCDYTSNKKCNVINHLNRKKICKRSATCTLSDNQIDLLNNSQFEKKNNNNNIGYTEVININNNQINNVNNINITINIDNLKGFNQDWDISKIAKADELKIIFSNIMYTQLLELILKDELNSNVIIDEKTNHGIIFEKKDQIETYEEIKIEKLVIESMKKLNKHLNEIYQNTFDDLQNDPNKNNLNVLNDFKESVQSKFDNFIKEPNTKNMVEKIIVDIYKSNNDKSMMFRSHKENQKLDNIQKIGY